MLTFRSFCVAIIAACGTVTATIALPACNTTVTSQRTLDVRTANLTVPGLPFGVVYASDNIAFVALATTRSVAVLNTSTFTPSLIREIALPLLSKQFVSVNSLAITRNKRTLFVAVGPGAVVIDVDKAIAGDSDAVVTQLVGTAGNSAIEVTLSHDDRYAFISEEYGNNSTGGRGAIEVFGLSRAMNGTLSSKYIGNIVLGSSVVGSALSADGHKLYVTSEVGGETVAGSEMGTLSILDVGALKTNPPTALLASVNAGCQPVRVAVSPNGEQVWVTARASNALLAFKASKLESNASNALLASVQVGPAPVGLVFVNDGRQIITADSNRYIGGDGDLSVVDVKAALQGKQGFPRVASGLFPREFALSLDGKTLLVSNYMSGAVQVVNVSQLARD